MPRPWAKRLFLISLPVVLAVAFWKTHIETDLNAFFTATDSEDAAFLASFLQSGELSRRYLIVVERRSGSSVDVAPFAQSLVQGLASIPAVERVWLANRPPSEWIDALKAYVPNHARLYSLEPQIERNTLFDPSTLRAKAEGLKRVLLSPQGGFVKQIAPQDPLLLTLHGFRGMQSHLEAPAGAGQGFVGVILQSHPPSLDAEAQGQLQSAIRQRFDERNAAAGGIFRLEMTGAPVFTVAAHHQMDHDVTVLSTVSSIGVVLIFLFLFRSFAALHWISLISILAYVAGVLATSLIFGAIHSLTLALGSTVIGVCIDYPMYVLVHVSMIRTEPAGAVARRLWPGLLMGGLTTIVGYCALGWSGFPGFQQIAVFASFGIVTALLLTRWVLPELLAGTALRPPHLSGLDAWIEFCQRHRKILLAVLMASLFGAAMSLPKMRWLEELQDLTMDLTALKQRDRAIRSHLTSVEPGRFVLVKARTLETALQQSEAVERRLRKLKTSGALSDYYGVYPWLVSARLQQENADVYSEAVGPEFRAAWRAAVAETGLSVEKLGSLSAAAATPMLPESALASEVRHILSGQIIEQADGLALVIWLGMHEPEAVSRGLADLPAVRYFSQRDTLNSLAQQYRDRALVMLGYGFLIMYLLLALRYRNGLRAFIALLPALATTLFIFAAWAVTAQAVSFLHVMALLLAISICVDYGIFFLDSRGRETDITYQAIAASMLTTAVSFGAMGLAQNPSLRVLSVTVTLGVTLGFALCPLLIRPDLPFNPYLDACIDENGRQPGKTLS